MDVYERNAKEWARERGSWLGQERRWLERFTRSIRAGGTILDVGCGSGEPIATHLIRVGYRIVGIDSSESLIAACKARHPDAEWHIQDMRTMSLGRRFDGVLAWDSFFHLRREDQRAMFARFEEHTEPGGVLMFTSGPREGESMGAWQGEPLFHASLDSAEYRRLLTAHGFVVQAHVAEDPQCGGHTVWLARRGWAS